MQPVKSLETFVLFEMAKAPLSYLDNLCNPLAVKLCEVSDPDIILPYLAEEKRNLPVCEKLKLALNLYLEVNRRKADYDTLEKAAVIISSSPPTDILIENNKRIAKVNNASLETLRKYNRIVDELKDGYYE